MRRFAGWLVLAVVSTVGCKAGPSAWESSEAAGKPAANAPSATGNLSSPGPQAEGSGREAPVVPSVAPQPRGSGSGAAADPGTDVEAAAEDRRAPEDGPAIHPRPFAEGEAGAGSERFPRPQHMRGIYLNAWASGSRKRSDELIDLARRTEVNTFVVDVKDASGYLSHASQVPLARSVGATDDIRIRDLPGLLDRLEAAGIYPVARIVIVKDPLLAGARPDMAIQDTAGGVWVDGKGIAWLDPHDRRVWEYHIAIAREVAELGFPEIQWDYVRFPDAPRSELARARIGRPGGPSRPEVIRSFLAHAREALSDLDVRVTADVFGLTTSSTSDMGIGQIWESVIDVVDVALPMVYPSHYYAGNYGIRAPNGRPYEVVRRAVEDALRRSATVEGAGATIPWLQDFDLGEPAYDAPEVRAQIQATYDAGVQEWVLWNPGSRYTVEALEPSAGFTREPLVRVAGRIVPVSRRYELLDTASAARAARDTTTAGTAPRR